MLKEDNISRNKWSLGIIVKLMPSKYSIVRVMKIQTKNNEDVRPTFLEGTVNKISQGGSYLF